jgi:hypothetical protein
MSVNGYMVDPIFASNVYSNKKAVDDITLLNTDLDENEIENIEDVELTFRIYDEDSFKDITTTDPITFKVNK